MIRLNAWSILALLLPAAAWICSTTAVRGKGRASNPERSGTRVAWRGVANHRSPIGPGGAASISVVPETPPADTSDVVHLVASDRAAYDQFGHAVAMDGDRALVGAPEEGSDRGLYRAGAAYIFRSDGAAWVEEAKLVPEDESRYYRFGTSLALSGDLAVVGAPGYELDDIAVGAVYVFRRTDGHWVQEARLEPEVAYHQLRFGESVDTDGTSIVVGAPGVDVGSTDESGAVYVFRRDGSTWRQEAELIPYERHEDAGFGTTVSVDGATTVVTQDDGTVVYFYRRGGSSWELSTTRTFGRRTAESAVVDGHTVLVSGTDEASLYLWNDRTLTWVDGPKLVPGDGSTGHGFGRSVALSGSLAVVGEPWDDTQGPNTGRVHVFRRDGTVWARERIFSVPGLPDHTQLGSIVATNGTSVLVGYPRHDNRTGTVYLFAGSTEPGLRAPELLAPADSSVGFPDTLRWHPAELAEQYELQLSPSPEFDEDVTTAGGLPVTSHLLSDDLALDTLRTYFWRVRARNATDTSRWSEAWAFTTGDQTKIHGTDRNPDDYFGQSVSMWGDLALVGAPGDDEAGRSAGAVYVYRRDGDVWRQEQKVLSPEPYYSLGKTTATDGTVALAAGNATSPYELAQVYWQDGAVWQEEAQLAVYETQWRGFSGPTGRDIHGDVVLVGEPFDEERDFESGAVHVFRRSGSTWTYEAKLKPERPEEDDYFGWSVALEGDVAVVGAMREGLGGAAYVFRWTGTAWTQEARLVASDVTAHLGFGWSVAISEDAILVGAWAAAYAFRWDGTRWREEQKIVPTGSYDNESFGRFLALAGDVAVIGSPEDDEQGANAGAAFVYRYNGTGWVQERKLMAADGEAGDQFGSTVATNGTAALVGLWKKDRSGAAYFFDLEQENLEAPFLLSPTDGDATVAQDAELVWSGVENASSYVVQMAREPAFQQPIASVDSLAETRYPLSGLDIDTLTYWRVRACAGTMCSEWTEPWSFAPGWPTVAPELTEPRNRIYSIPTTSRLAWHPAEGASTYTVQLSADDFASMTLEQRAHPDTTFTPGEGVLLPETTYAWRVRAENTKGYGPWSEPFTFTTTVAPEDVSSPEKPEEGDYMRRHTVVLEWKQVTRAASYEVFAFDSATSDTLYAAQHDASVDRDTTDFPFNVRVDWQVRACNEAGCGPWGYSDFVMLMAPDDEPYNVRIENYENTIMKVAGPVSISWYNRDLNVDARIQFSHSSEFDTILGEVDGDCSHYKCESAYQLPYNEHIYFRIQSYNDAGAGPWKLGSLNTFSLPYEAPDVLSPGEHQNVLRDVVWFHWSTVPLATSYRLEVAEDPYFASIVNVKNLKVKDNADEEDYTEYDQRYLDEDRTYYARVAGCNDAGCGPWDDVTFTTWPTRPPSPWRVAPVDRERNLRHDSLTFTWHPTPRTTHYELRIAAASFATPQAIAEVTDTTVVVAGWFSPNDTYYWQVAACNPAGCGEPEDEPWRFETLGLPPQVRLYAPGGYTRAAPHLLWYSVENYGDVWYQLWLSTYHPYDPTLTVNEDSLLTNNYTVMGAPVGSVADWRVRACNRVGCGYWSELWSFIIGSDRVTDVPTLLYPENHARVDATSYVTLSWTDVYNAGAYEIERADNDAFVNSTRHLVLGEASTSVTFNDYVEDRDYYWRVRACGPPGCSENAGPFSEIYHFDTYVTTVPPAPPPDPVALAAPVLASPVDGVADMPRSLTLAWSPVEGATGYHVQVAGDPSFDPESLVSTDATDNLEHDLADLDPGTSYLWRVRAYDGQGTGPWSAAWFFTTEAEPVVLAAPLPLTPDDGADGVVWQPAFSWEPVPEATTYRLQVALDASFSDLVVDWKGLQASSYTLESYETLAAGRAYRWRVSAQNEDGTSAWSVTRSFHTQEGRLVIERNYYFKDHLGSTRATVNEDGEVVHYDDYYPFGQPMPGRSWTRGTPLREGFTGHELDKETELFYAGARYYDPVIGRWNAVDPLADELPSWSAYSYAYNNPLGYLDPTGMIPWPLLRKWVNRAGKVVTARFSTNVGSKGGAFGARDGRHKGLDMNMGSGSDDLGAPVRSTHSGFVQSVVPNRTGSGAGNFIVIEAAGGEVRTRYLHLEQLPNLEPGEMVEEGQEIGFVGGTMNGGDGPVHLHYEVLVPGPDGTWIPINPVGPDGELIDPQDFVSGNGTGASQTDSAQKKAWGDVWRDLKKAWENWKKIFGQSQ